MSYQGIPDIESWCLADHRNRQRYGYCAVCRRGLKLRLQRQAGALRAKEFEGLGIQPPAALFSNGGINPTFVEDRRYRSIARRILELRHAQVGEQALNLRFGDAPLPGY